jgi:MoxR-like ATPase
MSPRTTKKTVTPDTVTSAPEVTEVVSKSVIQMIEENYPCPKEEEIGFHIEPAIWKLLVRNVMRGESTLLIGPTGSGKTELVSHLTECMEISLSIQDMGTIQDPQSALLGVHRIGKDKTSVFDPAPFVGYIQKEGVILLDELNRAPLSASNILFSCLDSRKYVALDVAEEGGERRIHVNPKTVFFATANLGAEYSGTNAIDRALLDRFFPIELSYPEESVETKILIMRTNVDEKNAKGIVKVAKEVRKQFTKGDLSNTISVRHTLQAASLVADGFTILEALNYTIMPLFDNSDGSEERAKIKSIIAAF